MAFSLPLPPPLPAEGWKVKIRDRERNEPPHVTILRGTRAWRINLRSGRFLDAVPDPKEVPPELLEVIDARWRTLRARWDEMYPENPVDSTEYDDD
jgi:hypothetical protein